MNRLSAALRCGGCAAALSFVSAAQADPTIYRWVDVGSLGGSAGAIGPRSTTPGR
jgi:hypothetical protein